MQSNLFFEKASNFPDMSICSSAAGHFFHLRKKKSQIIFNSYSMIDFIKVYTKQISVKLDAQMLVHFGTENF